MASFAMERGKWSFGAVLYFERDGAKRFSAATRGIKTVISSDRCSEMTATASHHIL